MNLFRCMAIRKQQRKRILSQGLDRFCHYFLLTKKYGNIVICSLHHSVYYYYFFIIITILFCGLHNVCSHITARSNSFICQRDSSACHVVSHTCTLCGPVLYVSTRSFIAIQGKLNLLRWPIYLIDLVVDNLF